MNTFRCTITLISNWCKTWHLYYSILSSKRFTCWSCHQNPKHLPSNQLSRVNPMQLSWYILSLPGKIWGTLASQLVLGLSVWRAINSTWRLPLKSCPPWPDLLPSLHISSVLSPYHQHPAHKMSVNLHITILYDFIIWLLLSILTEMHVNLVQATALNWVR